MRRALPLIVATMLTVAAAAGAQESDRLLSVDGFLDDYGLASLDDVQRGRVSLVHDPAGDRIALHFLRATRAPGPPGPPGPPAARPTVAPEEAAAGGDDTPEIKALWVWNTAELLRDAGERADFLAFVDDQEIRRVFLYVPAAEGEAPSAGFVPFDSDALAPLLAALNERGSVAYALDGDPDYVRPENHAGVLRTVSRVANHNRSRPAEERFYGVRYDIEPYLMRGFQGPRREEILNDYVALLASVAAVAREAGLAVGADIPFWFDSADEDTGEPFEAVLEGVRASVLEHVMATVDDVAIMAYRTTADGPDGVVAHAAGEVGLGRDERRARVFVGVETTHLYDEELYTFRGSGRVGLPTLTDAAWVVLEDLGEDRVRAWLVEGADALAELARRTSDHRALRYWFAGQPVPLPGDRLSFHSLGPEAMERVTGEVVQRFRQQPSFLGLAYHDYRGLRALLER